MPCLGRFALALVVPLGAALAGCADEAAREAGAAPAGFPSSPDAGAGRPGALEGRVTDDEARPVAGATVTLPERDRVATAAADGSFRLEAVAAGPARLRASAPGHADREETVQVRAGDVTHVDLSLVRLPAASAHHATAEFQGHYDCAHEIPIWTGDCMIAYESQAQQEDPVTSETFAFRTPVGPGWDSVVVELAWTYAANNQLDGMRLYLENGNGTEQGHSFKVARVDGPRSPLRLVVHRGEIDPRADFYTPTTVRAFIPDGGETVQLRVFPRGNLYDQTNEVCLNQGTQCLLGVGLGVDIRFQVYATVFYHAGAPDSFSALPP